MFRGLKLFARRFTLAAMKLQSVELRVADVARTAEFFEKVWGLTPAGNGKLRGTAGLPYLKWSSVNWEITNNKGGLRGETTMRHFDGRTLRCDYAIVPLVALLPIVLIWPIAWGGRIRSIERRRKANQCPNCGYDLRESPRQCPECGREVMRLLDDEPDGLQDGQIIGHGG